VSRRPPVHFERLGGGPVTRTATEILGSVRPRERAPAKRPRVLVNMVSTLDGRAALHGGTRELGGPGDLEMLLELRVLADAVMIGAGTLRAEGYGRLMRSPERRARRVAAGGAPDPPAVLVTRSLDLPWQAALFAAPEQHVLVYTDSPLQPPPAAGSVEVIRPRAGRMSLPWVLADLRGRGIAALLCEGGPRLNRSLLSADLVDELFLTISPLLTGDETEPAIVAGPPLAAPVAGSLEWVLRHGDDLFLRYQLRA
jgi:riboflavin biosynthesis pyrimidine reductase